jgi:hypothetical protein
MAKKTPLRDKKKVGKKIGKLLSKKPTKDKKEPVADKAFFERLVKRASQPIAKPDGKTLGSQNAAD